MITCNECGSEKIHIQRTYGTNINGRYCRLYDWGWLLGVNEIDWIESNQYIDDDPLIDVDSIGLDEGDIDLEFEKWTIVCVYCQLELQSNYDQIGKVDALRV